MFEVLMYQVYTYNDIIAAPQGLDLFCLDMLGNSLHVPVPIAS